jgi:SpoVK/Ycf46/Vps4 family AAA+-type ATPase
MASPIDQLQLVALGARRIVTDTDPDDLVLPEVSGRRLGWIANWLTQPPFIFREWGLSRFVDGGLRALFRGSSGTGKTMAAVALGKSTGRPLFHVDLAAVISNDVGDTERQLQQLFAMADEAGAILLFDEADMLVATLLRQIEPFEGLAIVTTHAAAEIEEDALTRIDVIVEFPMPDEAAREAIWRKLLASVKLPQGEVDVRALAKHELSGADILRSVRAAALVASIDERNFDSDLLQLAAAARLEMRQG